MGFIDAEKDLEPKELSMDVEAIPDEEYSVMILQSLNKQRKENERLCDISLVVGETTIPAHRSVLAASSPYFLAMFTAGMKESVSNVVEMKDVQPEIITHLIDYVYTGKLELVNSENVESYLQHATLLQLEKACKICCDFLEKQLEPLNCVGIRRFAAVHQCKDFLVKIDLFIKDHFMEIVNSEEFVAFSLPVLKSIISDQGLKIDNEEQVYNAVMKWVQHDATERGPKLNILLAQVKLPLLSKDFIMNLVDKEPLVKRNLKCRDLLDDAKNYHLQPENHSKLRSRRTLKRFSTSGLLFAVGGKETGEIITDKAECFCLYEKQWKPVSSLNTQRQQLCVCEVKGMIYAIAGTDGDKRMKSVEVYSLADNKWTETTPLQVCRSGAAAVSVKDTLYVLSGYDGRVCLTSVERLDQENEQWDYITPMNTGRSFPGACSIAGRIYIVGGNDGTSFLNTCEAYDPVSDKWSHIAPMYTSRAGIGCAVQDGVIYVAGGFDGNQRLDIVEIYEPRMDAWTVTTPMNFSRDGVSLASYGGFIHAIGGIDGPSYLNSVEYYDPEDDRWYTAFPMQTSRAAAGVAIIESDTYLTI